MKKNDIFTFTALNGVEVTAVAIYAITLFDGDKFIGNKWICYAQNRLFTMMDYKEGIKKYEEPKYEEVIVDYCTLPDYDAMLERYSELEIAQTETNLVDSLLGTEQQKFDDDCYEALSSIGDTEF